jgi:HEPN domain-containing protein
MTGLWLRVRVWFANLLLDLGLIEAAKWVVPQSAKQRRNATEKLFENALQYYVAGRYCFFAQLHPTVGNQFHHAIEFALKAALTHFGGSPERHHNIKMFWRRFKAAVKNPDLDKFNRTIAGLHKFERIRYPDSILERGMSSLIGFKREAYQVMMRGRQVPRYECYIDEIDEVFGTIFLATGLNPQFFTPRLNREAQVYLT